jgi:hypothetical protein
MPIQQNKNGRKRVPELPPKQKEAYKSAEKWPPPAGIIILTEEKPSTNAVLRMLTNLARIVKPSQRKYVERAKEKLAGQQ